MAKRRDNKQGKEVVGHPENLENNAQYSVLVEYPDGKLRRLAGRFVNLQTAYNGYNFTKPERLELVIVLRRIQDVVFIPWLRSKNWIKISD